MTASDDLLRELGELASRMGPAIVPQGTEDLLTSLTDTARRLFGASACSLALLTDDESELVYTTASGSGTDDITGMRMPATRGVAGWVVASGQPVAISDLSNDQRFARDVAEQTGYTPQAILAVPVQSKVRLLGVLSLLDRDADRPGAEQDLLLLSLFAEQAAIALEGARAFSDLGRVLLGALSDAVEQGTTLADAVSTASTDLRDPDRELVQLADLFAQLELQGTAERALAVRVVREVVAYSGRRSSRPRR